MGAHRQKRSNNSNGSTTERGISGFAGRQLHLINAEQLHSLGLSRGSISYRVSTGRLHRLHAGVYATHPPPYSRAQRWLAAVLACGPRALLSDLSAAALTGISDATPGAAQVSVPTGRGRTRAGIVVHRRQVDPRDVRRVNGVPCTSADRILIDLAPSHAEAELESMMVAADSLQILKRHRLAELAAERRGRPGIHRIVSILALEPQLTRSELERLFLPIWRQAGVGRPQVNFPIRVPTRVDPLTVDFAWPEIRLVVEADSQRYHGDWERAEADRERDQLLALAGWACHRFVRRRIVEDRSGSAERLRRLVEVRVAELAHGSITYSRSLGH